MDRIRVVLADDHAMVRSGLAALLTAEPDIDLIAEAATGEEAVACAVELQPDVVVMDLSMPGIGGLEATRRIGSLVPRARVLILTAYAEEQYVMAALEAGARGYVMKERPERDLIEGIRSVAGGDVFLHPTGARLLLHGFRVPSDGTDGRPADSLHLLSQRESEVLSLTVHGYTSAEIGERLGISPKTVDTYRQRFMEKLDLHHRSELVGFAIRNGLMKVTE